MALRAVLGLHHIPAVTSSSTAAFNKQIGDLPLVWRASGGTTPKIASFGGPGNPTLTSPQTTSDTSLAWGITTRKLTVDSPKRSVLGFRYKIDNLGSTPAGLGSTTAFIARTDYVYTSLDRQLVLSLSDFGTTTTAELAGKDYYVELVLNWLTDTVDLRIDGRYIRTASITTAQTLAAFRSRDVAVWITTAQGVNATRCVYDIYYLDDTEDDTLCAPLGPQIILPITANVESAENWTTTTGTVDQVLKTTVTTASPDTPTTTSPTPATPIVSGLVLPGVGIDRVTAVAVTMAGNKPSGLGTLAEFSLKDGGSTTSGHVATPETAIKHSLLVRPFEKAPDGFAWNVTKVNAAKLHLMPIN